MSASPSVNGNKYESVPTDYTQETGFLSDGLLVQIDESRGAPGVDNSKCSCVPSQVCGVHVLTRARPSIPEAWLPNAEYVLFEGTLLGPLKGT